MSRGDSELCIDALAGPTHNFAGLAAGNTAAARNAGVTSRPRLAALRCLDKAWAVARLGVPQLVLPPQPRPDLDLLRRLGYSGPVQSILPQLADEPQLLRSVFSASNMWLANAATVVPSRDSEDARCHVIPANQVSNAHRSTEARWNAKILRLALPPEVFVHHLPLPPVSAFADEGAANHMMVSETSDRRGVHVFVYGRDGFEPAGTRGFSPRQTRQAAAALARLGALDERRTLLVRQNPEAIDAGVFHNDVIATSHQGFLIYHEKAFHSPRTVEELGRRCLEEAGFVPGLFPVADEELSLSEAVASYLFNSQIVTDSHSRAVLLAPSECERSARPRAVIERLIADPACPLASVQYVDLTESMMNGGGPACLRLRVLASEAERRSVDSRFLLDEALYTRLRGWIDRHYRDTLRPADLLDPALVTEVQTALDAVTEIFGLPSLYDFQS